MTETQEWTQLGTESYERRLCAEAIEDLLAINAELLEVLKRAYSYIDNEAVLFRIDAAIAKAGVTS